MRFESFIDGPYALTAPQAAAEKLINMYWEPVAAAGGNPAQRAILVRTPGTLQKVVLPAAGLTSPYSGGRGMITVLGRCFCVAGGGFYELTYSLGITYTLRGSLVAAGFGPIAEPAAMCTTGREILICARGWGYVFNLATNVFTQITAPGFPAYPAAVTCCAIDTFFIAVQGLSPGAPAGTGNFSISSPYNGLAWAVLDFGNSQEPNPTTAVAASHNYLWLFSDNTTVVFQNTGAAAFPFQRVPGSQIEMGCRSIFTILNCDNTLFWIGSSDRGPAVVYRADGFIPRPISNYALEAAMQQYNSIATAVASTYEEYGHLFYRLDFPTSAAPQSLGGGTTLSSTWVYDCTTKEWHQRGLWDTVLLRYTADLAQFHAFAFGLHLVQSPNDSSISYQSLAYADTNGAPLRWLRASPHIADGQDWMFYSGFELDMQRGGGPGTPLVYLRWSDDGGMTWSASYAATSGAAGAYATRVRWLRLGRGRNRVFEVSGSDPVPNLAIMGAELDVTKGNP